MQPIKAGIKTTEFWATILGTTIVAGANQLGITLDASSTISIAAMVISYIIGRVANKVSPLKYI